MLPNNLQAIPSSRTIGSSSRDDRDLRKVEQDQWATTPVGSVMTAVSELATVSPDDQLVAALDRLAPATCRFSRLSITASWSASSTASPSSLRTDAGDARLRLAPIEAGRLDRQRKRDLRRDPRIRSKQRQVRRETPSAGRLTELSEQERRDRCAVYALPLGRRERARDLGLGLTSV